jgi:hypothetical protein
MGIGNIEARTVVICGSMKNIDRMTKIGAALKSAGLDVITPVPDKPAGTWSVEMSNTMKREAARRHMGYIRNGATAAILVVNVDRHGVRNYVGPNSFAEISVAFADDRRVFLLKGMPKNYEDELAAWGVECLHGDLDPLVRDLGGREIDSSLRAVLQESVA